MATKRNTKIVCTLGPATENIETIEELLKAGMNIARFNFSHGNHSYHGEMMEKLRKASHNTGIPAALMLDTKGPEIRTGIVKGGGKINLSKGQAITITTEDIECSEERISISYKNLHREIKPGNHIYIADGLIDLEVDSVEGTNVHCHTVNGGVIGSKKNVNIPGIRVSLPSITKKDTKDILFGIEQDIDFISASFIRRAENVIRIQDLLSEHNSQIRIISKIEDQEGIDNIDEIIRVSTGIMVARGDLGVQLSLEQIPLVQKRIIEKCNRQNRGVITATQMLDSMISNPRPTRAEMTDVANAIFDGTDAVMLSGETASGKYPVQTVKTMERIALAVEESEEYRKKTEKYFSQYKSSDDIGQAVAKSAYLVAHDVEASAIISPTLRGNSPRLISKYRPSQTIVAVTTEERTVRQLLLYWGIYPVIAEYAHDSDTMIQNALKAALKHRFIKKLDKVVTTAGIPLNSPIPMNIIKVHFLGNILSRGHGGFGGNATGRIVKAEDAEEAKRRLSRGKRDEILLTETLKESFSELIPYLRGIILEAESQISWEDIRKKNPNIVYISEVPKATGELEDGLFVSINGEEKIIYEGVVEFDS